MAYALYKFGNALLPDRIPDDSLYTGDVESTLLDSVGGVFDYYSSRQRLPRRMVIPHKGRFLGEQAYIVDQAGNYLVDGSGNQLINGTAASNLIGLVDAIREQLGKRDQLWRKRDGDGLLQWKLARLMKVDGTDTVDNVGAVIDLDLAFETQQAAWRSQSAITTSLGSGSGTRALTVPVVGNAPVDDAILRITAAATVTLIRVRHGDQGVDWQWTGTLNNGQALTIDAGAQTVRIGNSNAYSGLSYNSGHRARGFLPLVPGTNAITVETNANASITLTHYDQWI